MPVIYCSRFCRKQHPRKTSGNSRPLYAPTTPPHAVTMASSLLTLESAQRKTYTSRIEELDQLAYADASDDKALPARPATASDHSSIITSPPADDSADVSVVGGETVTKLVYDGEIETSGDVPPSPQHGGSTRLDEFESTDEPRRNNEHIYLQTEGVSAENGGQSLTGSHRRAFSDRTFSDGTRNAANDDLVPESIPVSSSWLDSKADSVGSASSSVHSRTSSQGVRRKYMVRPPSGDTEAEFDAALDAAVEAAYDDGYEPADSDDDHASMVANALMRVELAKERVRQSERETMEMNQGRDVQQNTHLYNQPSIPEDFYDDESSGEEERLLEEMTRGYEIEDFAFSQESALDLTLDAADPESDIWGSSALPNHEDLDTRGTRDAPSRSSMNPRPIATPLSQHSAPGSGSDSEDADRFDTEQHPTRGVRSRRFSGLNSKQLTIETSKLGQLRYHDPIQEVDGTEYGGESPSPDRIPESLKLLSGEGLADVDEHGFRETSSEEEDDELGSSGSQLARSLLGQNYSSSSLRSARSRNMSLSNLDDISDLSPGTPSSNPFGSTSRLPIFSTASTPMASTFDDQLSADPAESLYLFDGQYHGLPSPGSPGSHWGDAPMELEPCPNDFLLRPFWLMRCLYQTIAHPRGGYLSGRLFVPQDVWRVKGVKLRNVEDKVATCDYLTAALLKLGQVDTCDADAVLEEMQSLEGVLDQMAANLSRKLGNEVGVQTTGVLFKDTSNGADPEPSPVNVPRSASVSGRSAAPFSWRRLRAKNSAAGLAASYNGSVKGGENGMDSPSLESLPMTLHPTSRPPKRAVDQARFSGSHAGYMESLARLFDAAQALGKCCFPSCTASTPILDPALQSVPVDQIARQVEDPGLRHADKTQVGLELCTRHAAEFFAFYICRFVLSDLNILLEKFIKRGTEWVAA